MPPEPTLEQLFEKLEKLGKTASTMETFMATHNDKEHTEKEAKKAQEKKDEEEKMEAKKAKYQSAIKAAMEENDHEKKEAMVRAAQEELHDENKKEAFGKPEDEKHEATDEEKEKDAQVASIIAEKKNSLIKQILTANRIIDPAHLKDVEARLKVASITDVEKEWNIVKPFVAGAEQTPVTTTQQPFVPYFANVTPADIDTNQLNANSPDSDFNKLTTKELLEMGQ